MWSYSIPFSEGSHSISGIYSGNRQTNLVFRGILIKIPRNRAQSCKKNTVLSGSIVSLTRGVYKKLGQNSNASQRVPWKCQNQCSIPFGFGASNGLGEKSLIFLQKMVWFFFFYQNFAWVITSRVNLFDTILKGSHRFLRTYLRNRLTNPVLL